MHVLQDGEALNTTKQQQQALFSWHYIITLMQNYRVVPVENDRKQLSGSWRGGGRGMGGGGTVGFIQFIQFQNVIYQLKNVKIFKIILV